MSAVMESPALALLEHHQARLLEFVAREGQAHYSIQYHPDLSPSGWHLGHCVFTESYWIREVIECDPVDPALQALYIPELSPKPARGGALPDYDELLDWSRGLQRDHRRRLRRILSQPDNRQLLRRRYLAVFLIQHYAQHYETLCQIRAQRRLQSTGPCRVNHAPLPAATGDAPTITLPAGDYRIGAGAEHSPYDNEHPAHTVTLTGCRLARRPAGNADFLAFMQAGGYHDRNCWSAAGWEWRLETGCEHPEYWCRDAGGHWFDAGIDGPRELPANAPVTGISYHEAEAFARWRGARLPHEYEWEAAARRGGLEGTGQVWEWCDNPLHPYPGFEAFPYAGYSCPYFDGRHYVLRGGSRYTRDVIRRPSFRNYYEADKRHIFAGLRLVFDL